MLKEKTKEVKLSNLEWCQSVISSQQYRFSEVIWVPTVRKSALKEQTVLGYRNKKDFIANETRTNNWQ